MRLALTKRGIVKLAFLTAIFVGVALSGNSQTLLLMSEDSSFIDSRFMLEVRGSLDYRSNRLNNEFMDKFIVGGFINDELKDEVGEGNDENFRFGGGASGGIRFYNFGDTIFKNPNLGVLVNLSSHWHARASFTQEFYDMAMYGNRQFAGKNPSLDPINADYITWQQAGAGIFHKPTMSFVSLNVINGQAFSSMRTSTASVFTSADGDQLTVGLVSELNESDTLYSGFGVSNGVGSALNARINIPLKESKGFVSLQLQDFGFINWNEYTLTHRANTTYSFTGADINDVFSDENEIQFPSLQDSLFEETTVSKQTTFLPGRLAVTLNHRIIEKGFYTLGVEFIPIPEYIPLGRIGYSHFIKDKMLAGLTAEYGGFGNLRVGAQFQWWTKSNWYLQVQVNDMPGMFLKNAKGRGAQLVVSKFFNSKDDRKRTED